MKRRYRAFSTDSLELDGSHHSKGGLSSSKMYLPFQYVNAQATYCPSRSSRMTQRVGGIRQGRRPSAKRVPQKQRRHDEHGGCKRLVHPRLARASQRDPRQLQKPQQDQETPTRQFGRRVQQAGHLRRQRSGSLPNDDHKLLNPYRHALGRTAGHSGKLGVRAVKVRRSL